MNEINLRVHQRCCATVVIQISNLSKNLYWSGMYQNGHVPNWS